MIIPRLRSEARGGSSSGLPTRHSGGTYGSKIQHGQHIHDPDLKRALQYSYALQTVRKWEKRWVVIHETSMRVHKWMPAPTLNSQINPDQTVELVNNRTDEQQDETQVEQKQQESTPNETQDTQMMIDEESTSQSSQT